MSILIVVIILVLALLLYTSQKYLKQRLAEKTVTSSVATDKWVLAITVGLLAVLLNSPVTYSITDSCSMKTMVDGSPTIFGLLTHNILLVILIRFLIW